MTATTQPDDSTRPTLTRKGVSWDARARQFTSRVGYDLRDDGTRARSFQYLTADPDEATLKHIQLEREWDNAKRNWPLLAPAVHAGLPADLKGADLSKPVWPGKWAKQGIAAVKHAVAHLNEQANAMTVARAQGHVDQIDAAKAELATFKPTDGPIQLTAVEQAAMSQLPPAVQNAMMEQMAKLDLLAKLPPDLRARVHQALQPAANEVLGLAPDARKLTIRQAADEYKQYKQGKIGLNVQGRRRGGGIKAQTFNDHGRMLEYALKLLDPAADLASLTHERLEKFVDAAYRKATSPRTAYNWARALKSMLDWCHRNSGIAYRNPDTIDEIFQLNKPDTATKTGYTPETVATVKAIRTAAEKIVEKGGQPVWPFVVLALNTGMYAVDIAALTHANLRADADDTRYLWWQRQKEKHHNKDLWTRTDLWPETWAAIEPCITPDDPERNPTHRLFLSARGTPMYRTSQGHARLDVIGLRYKRCCNQAVVGKDKHGRDIKGADLPFKQLRKIGMNAMKKHSGGSDDITRKYAGQKVPGVLKAYLVDEFDDVAEALASWREQLVADGVLKPEPPT